MTRTQEGLKRVASSVIFEGEVRLTRTQEGLKLIPIEGVIALMASLTRTQEGLKHHLVGRQVFLHWRLTRTQEGLKQGEHPAAGLRRAEFDSNPGGFETSSTWALANGDSRFDSNPGGFESQTILKCHEQELRDRQRQAFLLSRGLLALPPLSSRGRISVAPMAAVERSVGLSNRQCCSSREEFVSRGSGRG